MISSFWSLVIVTLSSRITFFPSTHTFKEFTTSPVKFRDAALHSKHLPTKYSTLSLKDWGET